MISATGRIPVIAAPNAAPTFGEEAGSGLEDPLSRADVLPKADDG
jgi:hypothetical protein